MSNADPKPGGFTDLKVLTAAVMNLVRAGILAALDTGGGARTMLAKLTLIGADMFELDGGQLLYANAGTITRGYGAHGAVRVPTEWAETLTDVQQGRQRTAVATAASNSMRLDGLPHGNVLDSVTLYFTGSSSNLAEPANKPSMLIMRRAILTGVSTQIGSTTTLAWVDTTTYKTRQLMTVSGLAHTIDRVTNEYYVLFISESGANSFAGATVQPGIVSCTVTRQPKGY